MNKRWVYLGQGSGAGVPVIDKFQEIDENQEKIGRVICFKKFKSAMLPGGIYDVTDYDGDGVKEASVVFSEKMIKDDEWLQKINTEHLLFKTRKKKKALESKFKKEYKMSNSLVELAIPYRKLYGVDRVLYEALVIERLRELAGKA